MIGTSTWYFEFVTACVLLNLTATGTAHFFSSWIFITLHKNDPFSSYTILYYTSPQSLFMINYSWKLPTVHDILSISFHSNHFVFHQEKVWLRITQFSLHALLICQNGIWDLTANLCLILQLEYLNEKWRRSKTKITFCGNLYILILLL